MVAVVELVVVVEGMMLVGQQTDRYSRASNTSTGEATAFDGIIHAGNRYYLFHKYQKPFRRT